MNLKFTWRIWLLIIVVLFALASIFSIPPMFLKNGVQISSVEQNSTIFEQGLREGMVLESINGKTIETIDDYIKAMQEFSQNTQKTKLTIQTNQIEIIGLFEPSIAEQIRVEELPNTRLTTGLDLQGGTRALVGAENAKLSSEDIDNLISVSEQRLNVYGLSDVKFFKVFSNNENFMGVQIAGSTPQELEDLIASQGKFEAKIGNETAFTGDDGDITHVGKTGQDAMITDCFEVEGGEACNFRFVIFLSEEAAQRHADITKELDVVDGYLEEKITFYIDGKETSSLNIGADLKGNVATQIQISGSGSGPTRQEAIDNAKAEMKKLQAVLSTGSLPYKLEIVKLDQISPKLGEEFSKQILLAGLFAIAAVSIIIFIRYRKIKASIALISVSLSEVIIILGFAALFPGWTLDLPAIAGIIAAIGTGIDSQLVIMDEARIKGESIKQQIKKALFIITTSFATTFIAMVPLTGVLGFMGIVAAGGGLLKGFAITTIIGITTGVLISRPAFADIAKKIQRSY